MIRVESWKDLRVKPEDDTEGESEDDTEGESADDTEGKPEDDVSSKSEDDILPCFSPNSHTLSLLSSLTLSLPGLTRQSLFVLNPSPCSSSSVI